MARSRRSRRSSQPEDRPKSAKRAKTPEPVADLPDDDVEPLDDDVEPLVEPLDDEIELLDEDDLEILEEIEAAEEAEEIAAAAPDTRVDVTHELNGDAVLVTVAVGEMQKAEVIDAVTPSLRAAVSEIGSELRYRNVSVNFAGDTLIPSAAKALVSEVFAAAKPLKVIVRRGYGEECVHEGSLPSVQWSSRPDESYALKDLVEIDTGDLEDADLAVALAPELDKAAPQATGKAFDITFRGNASPDAKAKELLIDSLRRAGASRAALTGGEHPEVLFDQVLEELITIDGDGPIGISIALKGHPEEPLQAMALVLPRDRDRLAGQQVRVVFSGRDPHQREMDALLSHAANLQLERVEIDTNGELDVMWPPLLTVGRLGKQCTVELAAGGRDAAAVRAALLRESASLDLSAKRATTVDWPADLEVDEPLEEALAEALEEHQPASVHYTFGGTDREPVHPAPVSFRAEESGVTCDLDSDTGKPAELVRAIERRIPKAATTLSGKDVTINILGSGAVSRTMRRVLLDELQAAGARGIRLRDQGVEDIILPRLLAVDTDGDELRVAVTASGRDGEQIERALSRELESVECPEGSTVRLEGDVTEAVQEKFLGKGAGRLIVGGLQVHPALFAAPERDEDALTIQTAETAYAAEDPLPQLEEELPAILVAQGDLAAVSVTMVWPGATGDSPQIARAMDMVVAAGPAAFLLDDGDGLPMQLYPEEVPEEIEELEEPELIEELEEIPDEPAAPPEIAILGRKDDASPPMVVLGIDWTDDETAAATVEQKLEEMAGVVEGRRVLVVYRAGGQDHPGSAGSPLDQTVQRVLIPRVAALLPYRAPSASVPGHFEVVHSTVEALPQGMKVRDPRPSA